MARSRARRKQQAVDYADHVLGVKESPGVEPPPKTDVAKLLRDRYHDIINQMSDEDLLVKDFAPGLNVALKAQAQLDKREAQKSKGENAELAFAIIAMLGGQAPLQLNDGNTVEGEAVEIE
jgi:hypothetical protein